MAKMNLDDMEFSANEDEVEVEETVELSPAERLEQLEAEGDAAADYLEELLDICDLGGEFDIDVENDRATVEIVAEGREQRELQALVGRGGHVLEALQELTRLAVQAKTGQHSRLMLDVAGFRAKRRGELRELTERKIAQVKETGKSARLPIMNPFERKVCHDVVAEAGLISDSSGAEPRRFVVIHPAEED